MGQTKVQNRCVKFRIWDSKRKRMIPWDEAWNIMVTVVGSDQQEYEVNLVSLALLDNRHITFAQQFTGLLDKNGNEIYEGDILRVSDHTLRPGAKYFQGEHWMDDGTDPFAPVTRHCKVVWDSQGAFWTEYLDWFRENAGEDTGKPVGGWIPKSEQLEIIGNIYENPEILQAHQVQSVGQS